MVLKILKWLFVSIFSLLVGVLLYLYKPYVVVDEFRTTGQVETVQITYSHACGKEFFSDGENRYALVIPKGGKHPLDIPGLYFGSRFNVVGYAYAKESKNYLTGRLSRIRSERFDVVEWNAITPYHIYDLNRENLYREVTIPIGWVNQNLSPTFILTAKLKSVGC